jgi:hypothetical protein
VRIKFDIYVFINVGVYKSTTIFVDDLMNFNRELSNFIWIIDQVVLQNYCHVDTGITSDCLFSVRNEAVFHKLEEIHCYI